MQLWVDPFLRGVAARSLLYLMSGVCRKYLFALLITDFSLCLFKQIRPPDSAIETIFKDTDTKQTT